MDTLVILCIWWQKRQRKKESETLAVSNNPVLFSVSCGRERKAFWCCRHSPTTTATITGNNKVEERFVFFLFITQSNKTVYSAKIPHEHVTHMRPISVTFNSVQQKKEDDDGEREKERIIRNTKEYTHTIGTSTAVAKMIWTERKSHLTKKTHTWAGAMRFRLQLLPLQMWFNRAPSVHGKRANKKCELQPGWIK